MIVTVHYTVLVTEEVELEDDKYEALLDDDWYNDNWKEANKLVEEMENDILDALHTTDIEICGVYDENDEHCIYEN